ncbi:MAG: threonine--tRNA ligase [Chloroflexi bacterium]|nr:threonine--tRNA ligase [Chloroflexota bacterium]
MCIYSISVGGSPVERYQDSELYRMRHSMAHVMVQAVLEQFPGAKIAIGPPIEDGFYYDFDLPRPIEEKDLKKIEKRMKEIIQGEHAFVCREVSEEEARALFADQPYKLELIDGLVKGKLDEYGNKIKDDDGVVLTTYRQDSFEDLCRGPHVDNTRQLNPEAFSITFKEVAGAYWRGDENNPMLTRIYGTAWKSSEDLEDYLHRLEEAKQRDHRKVGVELGLFAFSQKVGKGLPLWKPRGAIVRNTLERFLQEEQIRRGYEPVITPHIARIELYETSGHYPYYSDSQYDPIDVDGELFMLRPMNCPHHVEVYKADPHSYRDLPIRLMEFGTVYRYEQSGELAGLTRVRGFTVDDAHIFVTPDQLLDEFLAVVDLIQFVFNALGMHDFDARVGIRDPESDKYIGEDDVWQRATDAIIQACEIRGLNYTVEEGEAAFYGPKLDFIFRDVLKREWQLGTVQVDYSLPERFELEYIGADNKAHRPIMIHRAPFGSLERFIGILTEHFYGAFPLWLAPVQMAVLPVSKKVEDEANALASQLKAAGFRTEVFHRGQLGKKIAEARSQKIPYLVVLGPRDVEAGTVSVRLRDDTELDPMSVEDFIRMAQQVRDNRQMDLVVS